jgi:polysaccharide pyruvyl transferase WcaK-like protein
MKKYRIAHIGAFDFENYGDLLFVDVFERTIRKHIEVEEIVLFAPKRCKMPFSNEEREVYSVTELEKKNQEKSFDAIVVGGGDLVHCFKLKTYMPHISKEWVDYEVLYMWMIPSIISWKYGIPLLWNAPGVPLMFMDSEKLIVKELCQLVDYISVRDKASRSNLEECQITSDIQVVPDTVFSVSELISKDELEERFKQMDVGLEKNKYIVFHANYTFLQTEMQGCIETLRKIKEEHQLKILLLPIGYALGDETFITELMKECPGEFVTISNKMNPMEMLTVIANAAGYVGASLHGCITAATYNVPIVACNYNRYIKVDGFLELVDLKEAVVYNTKDIYPVFQKRLIVSDENRKKVLSQIENHFKRLADQLEGKKTTEKFDVGLCEYVFSMRNLELKYQDEYRCMQNEKTREMIEREGEWQQKEAQWQQKEIQWQQKEAQWQWEYHKAMKAYQEILNSTVWKMTKPIRVLLNMIKRIK